ncbi:MAG TPA: hypothetical protein V6D31_04335 [Candidatus Sericytochromatia bacterium]
MSRIVQFRVSKMVLFKLQEANSKIHQLFLSTSPSCDRPTNPDAVLGRRNFYI